MGAIAALSFFNMHAPGWPTSEEDTCPGTSMKEKKKKRSVGTPDYHILVLSQ